MLVKLIKDTTIDNRNFFSLMLGQSYTVIGIEADDYRILNDSDEPYIYDRVCFEVVDTREPDFWKCKVGNSGERYCYPQEFSHPGFFEDYHNGKPESREQFWKTYKKLYTSK